MTEQPESGQPESETTTPASPVPDAEPAPNRSPGGGPASPVMFAFPDGQECIIRGTAGVSVAEAFTMAILPAMLAPIAKDWYQLNTDHDRIAQLVYIMTMVGKACNEYAADRDII